MHGSPRRHALFAAASLMLAGCGVLPGNGVLSGGGGSQAGGRGGGAAAGPGGRSAPGISPPGMVCGEIGTVIPEIIAVDVLIVIDASAAMNDDASGGVCSGGCGAGSKWAQAAAAIDRLVADTNSTVNWGLEIFPDPGSACAAGGGVGVPVGPARAAAIAAAINQRTGLNGGVIPGGNAPIRGAIDGAATYLAGLTDPNPKFILLVTAGAASCLPGSSDSGADDSAGSVQAITDARNEGFPTTVLGVVTPGGTADRMLEQMAIAGGRAGLGAPRYTPVGDVADLTTTNTLLRINPPCTFSIPLPPSNDGTTSRADIGVKVDGLYIPQDPSHLNGWDYVDAALTALELYGPACEALTGPPHTVSIVFHCDLQ